MDRTDTMKAPSTMISLLLATIALSPFTQAADSSAAVVAAPVPCGRADFVPTPDHPVGFRGDGTGHFPGATPPISWDVAKGTGVAWKTALAGKSHASVIVVGQKVFAASSPHHLYCLDADTGAILWRKDADPISLLARDQTEKVRQDLAAVVAEVKAQPKLDDRKAQSERAKRIADLAAKGAVADDLPHPSCSSLAPSTPASDGTRVYVQFPAGILAAYDLTGKELWKIPAQPGGWPMGNTSPVVCQGRVLAVCGGRSSPTLMCVDAATGAEQWRANFAGVDHTGAGTPAVVKTTDGWKVVTPVRKIFDLTTGKEWRSHAYHVASGASPVVDGTRLILAHSEKEPKQVVIFDCANTATGEGATLWPRQSASSGSPLVHAGKIYLPDQRGCALEVLDLASGQVLVASDRKNPLCKLGPTSTTGTGYALEPSPTLAGKHLFQVIVDGQTVVIEPGVPLKVLAVNPGAETHASPFFQGSRIYLRTHDQVVCIGKTASSKP
jgi:outer membrane protein assembly factor BamB